MTFYKVSEKIWHVGTKNKTEESNDEMIPGTELEFKAIEISHLKRVSYKRDAFWLKSRSDVTKTGKQPTWPWFSRSIGVFIPKLVHLKALTN